MPRTTKLLVAVLWLGALSTLPAQDAGEDASPSAAELMLQLDKVLPRKAPNPSQVASFSHSIDWDQKLDQLGELLARSAGTRVEPHVMFIMGNSLYSAGRISEARATFKDLKTRYPEHGLVNYQVGDSGLSAIDEAIQACDSELTFRNRQGQKSLPGADLDEDVLVTLHFSAGDVKVRFYEEAAPKHRENFLKLAKEGFYDRTRVHRVNPGRYIHLGDPNSRSRDYRQWGRGDPGYTLPSEFSLATHKRGTLSMNRAAGRNKSHGCQFQVLLTDQPHLDFGQTAFGEVVEGIDIVEEISRMSRNQYEAPVEDVFVNGISVSRED